MAPLALVPNLPLREGGLLKTESSSDDDHWKLNLCVSGSSEPRTCSYFYIFLGDPSEKKQPVSTFSGVSRGSLARSVKSEAKPSPGGFAGSRRLSCLANLGKNIANAFHQPTLF